MKRRINLKINKFKVFPLILIVGLCGLLLAACSSNTSSTGTNTNSVVVKPVKSFSGPAQLTSAGPVMTNNTQWLLAGTARDKTLVQINLNTGALGTPVPESSNAVAITETINSVIAVGIATPTSGSVEIRNGSNGALVKTIPVSAPVFSISSSSDGSLIYVLTKAGNVSALQEIATASDALVGTSIPLVSDAISVAATTNGGDFFVLEANGKIDEVPASGVGRVESFSVGSNATSIVLSSDSQTLYALKCPPGSCNVSIVDVIGQQVEKVIPAPLDTVSINLSLSGGSIWDAAGNSAVGNVQEFSLS
jgi:hypothetical protein